jgi:hypothetical protein
VSVCGDNSCMFGQATGMGTNGGCRCLDVAAGPGERVRIRKAVAGLRSELRLLREVEAALRNPDIINMPKEVRERLAALDAHRKGAK